MSASSLLPALFTIAALAAATAPASADCPSDDWISAYNGFCYLMVNNTWPWYVTKDACDQIAAPGAQLASTHDVELNAFIAESVAGSGEAWLGMTRATTYADWTWTDGTPFDFNYWFAGEPAGGGELCGLINCGRVGEWCAKDCHEYNNVFVCQIEDSSRTTTSLPPTTAATTAEPTTTAGP